MTLILSSCVSKKKMKLLETSKTENFLQMEKDSSISNVAKVTEVKQEIKQKTETSKEEETETEVKGTAEPGKPVQIYDIKDGDTLQSLTVTGNANVIYKKKTKISENNKTETKKEEFSNSVEQFLKTAVNEKVLEKTGTEIRKQVKETAKTDTSFGVYITAFLCFVVVVCLILLFNYFNKKYSMVKRFSNFINPKNN